MSQKLVALLLIHGLHGRAMLQFQTASRHWWPVMGIRTGNMLLREAMKAKHCLISSCSDL